MATQAPPFLPRTLILAANGQAEIHGDFDSFSVQSATAPNNLTVAFNDGADLPWSFGGNLNGLRAFGVKKIVVKDTSGVQNTVTVNLGAARFTQANQTSLPPGAATAALQQSILTALALVPVQLKDGAGTAVVLGQALMAASLPVALASNQSAIPVKLQDNAGAAIVLGQAAMAASVPVVLANNQTSIPVAGPGAAAAALSGNPVRIAASDGANTQNVSAVADNTATPAAGNLTAVPGLYNSAARALTSARVAFLSIDRGGKVLTFPCATLDPVLAGYSVDKQDAAASTNGGVLKAAAGMVYEVTAVNNAAYDVFIRLYDKATAPTVGTDVANRVVRVPAGQSVTVTFPGGAYFSAGVGRAVTKLVAYNDATAVLLHDLQWTIQYA